MCNTHLAQGESHLLVFKLSAHSSFPCGCWLFVRVVLCGWGCCVTAGEMSTSGEDKKNQSSFQTFAAGFVGRMFCCPISTKNIRGCSAKDVFFVLTRRENILQSF